MHLTDRPYITATDFDEDLPNDFIGDGIIYSMQACDVPLAYVVIIRCWLTIDV
jgi:hypothetical protein